MLLVSLFKLEVGKVRDNDWLVFGQPGLDVIYSSTCLERTFLYPSKSVPTRQVSPHRRDRRVGVEGSVLHIYGRHMCG